MLARGYAVLVISLFLGAQLHAVLPPGNAEYWPFMNYPMYAGARYRTDVVRLDRLVVVPCDTTSRADTLSLSGLGMTPLQTVSELRLIADTASRFAARPSERGKARAHLRRLLRTRYPGRYCGAEIWEQVFPNDGSVRALERPWLPAQIMPLDAVPGDSRGSAGR